MKENNSRAGEFSNENYDAINELESENVDSFDYLPKEERQVNIDRSTYSIYEIYRRYKRNDIIIQPFYQRGSVWQNSKKSKLIESVISNIPIPSFYFAELQDGKWEVVDGQQRLRAFFDFIDGEYQLSSLSVLSELNKSKFSNLPPLQQRKIEDYILHIFIIQKNSHPDIRFDIFERINEGATQLNAQELRNSMFRDNQNSFLEKLSKKPSFIKLTKGKLSETRLKDQEAVLRFLSFYKKGYKECYSGNMNSFLNDTMSNFHSYFSEDNLKFIEDHFSNTMNLIFEVFGENAFTRNNRRVINMSLFDIISYSFSKIDHTLIFEKRYEINELYLRLTENDEEFVKSISYNTLSKENLNYRFEVWLEGIYKILKEGSS